MSARSAGRGDSRLQVLFLAIGSLAFLLSGEGGWWRAAGVAANDPAMGSGLPEGPGAGSRPSATASLPELTAPLEPERAASAGEGPASWSGITVHHTVVDTSLENLEASHRSRGLGGLAYHLLILRDPACDGCVVASRRWLTQEPVPQTSEPWVNEQTVGVALVGDSSRDRPTAAQMGSLERVVGTLRGRFLGISAESVRGHGELAATACPGSSLLEWLADYRAADGAMAAHEGGVMTPDQIIAVPSGRRGTVTPSGAGVQAVSPSQQLLYDEAYTLFHQGRFHAARQEFERFLRQNGSSELSDNAAYWIASAALSQGDCAKAITEFADLRQRFPDGNKVPDALLKSAQCHEMLGNREGALAAYHEIVQEFPDTAAALAAAERARALS